MACQDFDAFKEFILQFDQKVEIDKAKDKPLRYNVWETTQQEVMDLTARLDTSVLENPNQSPHILRRMESAILRIKESSKSGKRFQKDIFSGDFVIEKSIALHELMESVKGESDKARNLGIEVSAISDTGVLPALPLSRIAASIGRKIAFQKGYRFKRATNEDSAAKIEGLYYDLGNEALIQLEKSGYAKLHDDVPTIMDYVLKEDLDPASRKVRDNINTDVLSVSLDEGAFKIRNGYPEADYFLDRTQADLSNTDLGVATDMLRLSRYITQASTIVLPDTKPTMSEEELAQWDDGIDKVDPKTAEARKAMYDKPLFVHDSLHDLMTLLNQEALDTGQSATKIITDTFGSRKNMINSLFGLKRSDNYSIDKKESVAGQNMSKTTPLDDLVEYYDVINEGFDGPAPLHMPQKIGRNARLYYLNSVLNPHASKQSRYMLTPGKYTVDIGSADYGYLAYQVGQALDSNLTMGDITGETNKLSEALAAYEGYLNAKTLDKKLKAMGPMARAFPGVDYVQLLTSLQAVRDIRSPVDGKVTTQFTVSADATASGGTLTFLQALGTNENVTEFFQRIGMFKAEGDVTKDLDDLYGLMSDAISGFVSGTGTGIGPDIGGQDTQALMQDTLEMLFLKQGKDVRELSKDPTMTFVYGQGKKGATQTLSRSLADRIIDNLDNPETRNYMARLLGDDKYKRLDSRDLTNTRGLYKDIVAALVDQELPQQLFELMKDTVKDEYLKQYQQRSEKVWNLVKKMDPKSNFKVLPAGAVLAGKTAAADLAEYGMPISKKVEVLNTVKGRQDTVLTRRDKVQKTVFDVSTVHGIDAAQMFHSIADSQLSAGIMSIHDDIRGTVADVRAMEAQYAKTTLDVVRKYDVHQQMMEAIAAQSPEIAATKEFIDLKAQIDADVAAKNEILDSGAFNEQTDALIGDGKAYEDFSGLTSEKELTSRGRARPEAAAKTEEVNSLSEVNDTNVEPEAAGTQQSDRTVATPNQSDRTDKPATQTGKNLGFAEPKKVVNGANAKPEPEAKAEEAAPQPEPTPKAKAKEQEDYRQAYDGVYENKLSMDYLNFAVASMINSKLERAGKNFSKNVHDALSARFPVYTDVADKIRGIYDGSPALQQLLHTVTGEGVDKMKKADILAQMAAINSQRTEIINDQVSQLNTLSRDLSDKDKITLDVLTSQTPLHHYFTMASEFQSADAINEESTRLRAELWKLNARAVRDIEDLVDLNLKKPGKVKYGQHYNMDALPSIPKTGDFANRLKKYYALRSIEEVGAKKFEKLLENTELMNVIKDNSVANAISTLQNEGTSNVRDSLVQDYWKEPQELRAVDQKEFRFYEFGDNSGWKVLEAPTPGKLGIVYKPIIDSSDIAGAYTDTKLANTDITVDEKYRKMDGVYKTANGYKLVLSKQQKRDLGLIEDFAQGLVRSAAHSIAIQESQIIRDSLLVGETHLDIASQKNVDKLQDIIAADNVDNPWFLKLGDTPYGKLPKEIRAKYQPVQGRASNVKGFDENVDLVRKDISHWLLGASAKSLFQNPQLKWAVRILKNLVSGAKIGMVVLNPLKIANDNLSNLTYLGVLGVSPAFIAQNYHEISKDFADYSNLQRQIFQMKLQLVSRPESDGLKKKIGVLQKRLKQNSIGDIGDKGFVNSLGSDLVSRSADTLSGFQADMHKSLEYLLTKKDGTKNHLSKFIVKLQDLGFQGEGFFDYIANIAGRYDSTKLIQQELDQVANRLREIRTDEDVINYVSQITTSPSSELVRVGSAMTDLTDVLAKETLYRHFVKNQGMSPEDARIKVLDSFPDYKENMPLAVKELSDVGIIMFPSFWLRIQKVIYRMMRDKPINLASELMIQEMVGSDINTIFEANVINKSNTFGGLIHPPFEPVGINSVLPKEIFG